jgi:hypothetical protein
MTALAISFGERGVIVFLNGNERWIASESVENKTCHRGAENQRKSGNGHEKVNGIANGPLREMVQATETDCF